MRVGDNRKTPIPGGRDVRRKKRRDQRRMLEHLSTSVWQEAELNLSSLSDEAISKCLLKVLLKNTGSDRDGIHPFVKRSINKYIKEFNIEHGRSVELFVVTQEIARPRSVLSARSFHATNVGWSFRQKFWQKVDSLSTRERPRSRTLLGLLAASIIADGVFEVETLLCVLRRLILGTEKLELVGADLVLSLGATKSAKARTFYTPSAITLSILHRVRGPSVQLSPGDIAERHVIEWLSEVFPDLELNSPPEKQLVTLIDIAIWDLSVDVDLPFSMIAMSNRTIGNYQISLDSWVSGVGQSPVDGVRQATPISPDIIRIVNAPGPNQAICDLKRGFENLFREVSTREIPPSEMKQRFDDLEISFCDPGPQLLLAWLKYKASKVGGEIKASSLERYYGAIGPTWLKLAYGLEADEIDAELEYDVRRVLRDLGHKSGYALERYAQFRRFIFGDEESCDLSRGSSKCASIRIPRRELVWGAEFQELLHRVKEVDCLSVIDLMTLKAMAILAYRCGLRRREIFGLRLSDVLLTDREIIVRRKPNKILKGKTASSERRIHLSWFLPFEEVEFMRRWIMRERVGRPTDDPLVHFRVLGEGIVGYDRAINLISALLKEVCGRQVVFHSMRHAAANWWYCLLHNENDLAEKFCDQPVGLGLKFCTSEGAQVHDRTWIVSNHMGHINPSSTANAYLKLNDLILGGRMRAYWDGQLDAIRARKLSGMNRGSVQLWFKEGGGLDYSAVSERCSNFILPHCRGRFL